jgi:hypothetical protein
VHDIIISSVTPALVSKPALPAHVFEDSSKVSSRL